MRADRRLARAFQFAPYNVRADIMYARVFQSIRYVRIVDTRIPMRTTRAEIVVPEWTVNRIPTSVGFTICHARNALERARK